MSSSNRMHKRPRYDSRDEISIRHEFDSKRYLELDSQVKVLKSELENEEHLRKKVQLFLGEKLAEIEQLQKENNSMHRTIEHLQSQLENATKQLHIALGMTVNREKQVPPIGYPSRSEHNMWEVQQKSNDYRNDHRSEYQSLNIPVENDYQSSHSKQYRNDKRSSTEERISKRKYDSPSSSKHSRSDGKSSEYSKANNSSKQNFQISVGDLSRCINIEKLRDAFAQFGEITDVKVMEDSKNSFLKGYGFVSFANQRDAERAIGKMDGTRLGRRRIRTNWAASKLESSNQLNLSFGEIMSQIGPEVTSIFAGNIPKNAGYDDLITAFERYGKITTIRDFTEQGNVFITFKTKESAANAIQQMNNTDFMGHTIKCYWAKGMCFFCDLDLELTPGIGTEDKRRIKILQFKSLQAKIHQRLREGVTRKDIFIDLCSNCNIGLPLNIDELCLEKEDDNYPNVYSDHVNLIIKIKKECGKRQSVVAKFGGARDQCFMFIDARYVLNFASIQKQLRLYLVDVLHGEKRQLNLIGKIPDAQQVNNLFIEMLDATYALIFESQWKNGSHFTEIHLIQLDLQDSTCTFLDSQKINFSYISIMFDRFDRRQFVVHTFNIYAGNGFLIMCRVEKDRIVISRRRIQVNKLICFGWLNGNKLQFAVLKPQVQQNASDKDDKKEVWELLLSDQANPEPYKLFDLQVEIDKNGSFFLKFFGNIGILAGSEYVHEKCLIYVLDLDKRTMRAVRNKFYGSIYAVHLENENTLSCCVFDYNDESMYVQTCTLNQPDTLQNQIYSKFRREAIFHNGDSYKKLLKALPTQLRPFNGYHSLQE